MGCAIRKGTEIHFEFIIEKVSLSMPDAHKLVPYMYVISPWGRIGGVGPYWRCESITMTMQYKTVYELLGRSLSKFNMFKLVT